MSPQMSHREEVLCKMTSRIRITISLHTVPDTSSHGGICESGLGERLALSLCIPRSFRLKPVPFHYFSALWTRNRSRWAPSPGPALSETFHFLPVPREGSWFLF